jgi:hypothetical protein
LRGIRGSGNMADEGRGRPRRSILEVGGTRMMILSLKCRLDVEMR